jgi:hypothetical protein
MLGVSITNFASHFSQMISDNICREFSTFLIYFVGPGGACFRADDFPGTAISNDPEGALLYPQIGAGLRYRDCRRRRGVNEVNDFSGFKKKLQDQ